MRTAGYRRGYRIGGRARRVNRKELDRPGMVIAFDRAILRELRRLHSRPTCDLFLLSDFLPGEWPRDLPDPSGEKLSCHYEVLNMIERGCSVLLNDFLIPKLRSPKWLNDGTAYQTLFTPDNKQVFSVRKCG